MNTMINSINFKASNVPGHSYKILTCEPGKKPELESMHTIRLNPSSKHDQATVKALSVWNDKNKLTTDFIYDFMTYRKMCPAYAKREFFALTNQKKNFANTAPSSILGIMELTLKNEGHYKINILETNPQYAYRHKNRRHRGIGSALINFAKLQAKHKNLYLNALRTAIPFYLKHGFKIIQEDIDEPLLCFIKSIKR